MGDSWDETSVEVSEADLTSFAKNVDSDDMDAALFGGLSSKPSKPSLLQAMKKSTGKTVFDEDENKPAIKPRQNITSPKPEIKKPVFQSTPKPVSKAKATPSEDDLLADLLGDSDYSEISHPKVPQRKAAPAPARSTPAAVATTPSKGSRAGPPAVATPPRSRATPSIPSKGAANLFDDDEDVLDMLDSEKDMVVKPKTPAPATAPTPLNKSRYFKNFTKLYFGEDIQEADCHIVKLKEHCVLCNFFDF